VQAVVQAGFGEGELVVLSLEALPGRRPQPGVARALVIACDASHIKLSLQRRLRASIANPPAQVPAEWRHCTALQKRLWSYDAPRLLVRMEPLCAHAVQALRASSSAGGGLTGPGVRWRVDRDDVASVFPRLRAALVELAGNVRAVAVYGRLFAVLLLLLQHLVSDPMLPA
jgi:hypothetical protein